MSWHLEGTYFESCSCDAVCPCTWSGFAAKATTDRCRALLAYHIETGEIDGVDVSDLSFALFLDTPPLMTEGNWRVGVFLDSSAGDEQAGKLGEVIGGQAGGPLAMLTPLISEMLGMERVPMDYRDNGRAHSLRIGDIAEVTVEDFAAGGNAEPVKIINVFHPSNSTLTVAPASSARFSTFGIEWGRAGESGFSAPFAWAS
jgi:hypothetical protein